MRDGGLLALRCRPCGGWRQTALVLRWLNTVVVSDQGKGVGCGGIPSGGDQEDVPEAPAVVGVAGDASKGLDGIESLGPPAALVVSLAGARVPGQAVPGV